MSDIVKVMLVQSTKIFIENIVIITVTLTMYPHDTHKMAKSTPYEPPGMCLIFAHWLAERKMQQCLVPTMLNQEL